MSNTLYLVATPIGNLQDISYRAAAILQQVAAIACEDTRVSRRLLDALGIDKPLFALHQHNEHGAAQGLIARLLAGEDIALISDAGTPVISDPGAWLVKSAHEQGIRVVPVPGANAAVAALSASGLPGDRFHFAGFIPAKSSERRAFLQAFGPAPYTVIFYESPHRIADTLSAMREVFDAERPLVIARELSKTFEQIAVLTAGSAPEWLAEDEQRRRGEFVLLLGGQEQTRPAQDWEGLAEDLLAQGLAIKSIARLLQSHCGANKKTVYNYLLAKKDDSDAPNR